MGRGPLQLPAASASLGSWGKVRNLRSHFGAPPLLGCPKIKRRERERERGGRGRKEVRGKRGRRETEREVREMWAGDL